MLDSGQWFAVGLDTGGTAINATVIDSAGRFLVDEMVESPSCVLDGPDKAIEALAYSLEHALEFTGIERAAVRAVGLDTPGPVSAHGVISSKGGTNFSGQEWRGFDVRRALQTRLGLPVVFNNDANAAALYAHYAHFGPDERLAALFGFGNRGHRPRRRCDRGGTGSARGRWNGRRTRAHLDPDGRTA